MNWGSKEGSYNAYLLLFLLVVGFVAVNDDGTRFVMPNVNVCISILKFYFVRSVSG